MMIDGVMFYFSNWYDLIIFLIEDLLFLKKEIKDGVQYIYLLKEYYCEVVVEEL